MLADRRGAGRVEGEGTTVGLLPEETKEWY